MIALQRNLYPGVKAILYVLTLGIMASLSEYYCSQCSEQCPGGPELQFDVLHVANEYQRGQTESLAHGLHQRVRQGEIGHGG